MKNLMWFLWSTMFCIWILLGLAFVSSCALPSPDGVQVLVEKAKQTAECQQIASECFEAVGGITENDAPLQAVELLKSCNQRWKEHDCAKLVHEYIVAAEAL